MSIEAAEKFKADLTDKFVVVQENVPELRRFAGLTGKVKTVNMSCRALVEFDGPADISWYDIDPAYLKVIDEPLKKQAAPTKSAAQAETKPAAKKSAGQKVGGKSPLELARQQGSGKAAATVGTETAVESKPAGKKLSPLERARRQDAAGKAKQAEPAPTEAAKTFATPPKPSGKKLSPLEQARRQDAGKTSANSNETPEAS